MTKREVYEVIGNVFAGLDNENKADVLEMVEKEIAALDRKNAKAKERAAAKKEEGDALRGTIEGILNDTPKTVNDILDEIGDETLTPAKIVSRVSQLVRAEKAIKEVIKVDNRKLTAYTKA